MLSLKRGLATIYPPSLVSYLGCLDHSGYNLSSFPCVLPWVPRSQWLQSILLPLCPTLGASITVATIYPPSLASYLGCLDHSGYNLSSFPCVLPWVPRSQWLQSILLPLCPTLGASITVATIYPPSLVSYLGCLNHSGYNLPSFPCVLPWVPRSQCRWLQEEPGNPQ